MMHTSIISDIGNLHTLLTNQPAMFSPFLHMLYALAPEVYPYELRSTGPWPSQSGHSDTFDSKYPIIHRLFDELWTHTFPVIGLPMICSSHAIVVTKTTASLVHFRRLVDVFDGKFITSIPLQVILMLTSLINQSCLNQEFFQPIVIKSNLDFVNLIEYITACSSRNTNHLFRLYYPLSSYTPLFAEFMMDRNGVHFALLTTFYRMTQTLYSVATSDLLLSTTGYTLHDSFPFTCLPLCSHTLKPSISSDQKLFYAHFMLEIDVSFFRFHRSQSRTVPGPTMISSIIPDYQFPDRSLPAELADEILLNLFSTSTHSDVTPVPSTVPSTDIIQPNVLTLLVRPPQKPLSQSPSTTFDLAYSLRVQFPVTMVLWTTTSSTQRRIARSLLNFTNDVPTSILSTDFHLSRSMFQTWTLTNGSASPCLTVPDYPGPTPSLLGSLDSPSYNPRTWCLNSELKSDTDQFESISDSE